MSTNLDQEFVSKIIDKNPIDKDDVMTLVREVERFEAIQKQQMSLTAFKVFESRGLHGQEYKVEMIKKYASHLYDAICEISVPPGNTEAGRLVSIAKTELESCVMFAVKAVSRFE